MLSRTLFAAVAVFAFVAWTVYPDATAPREGRELCGFEIRQMGPGERVTLGFAVRDAYTEMTFNYNLGNASHLRAALTGPDGTRHDAVPDVVANELDLSVARPARGDWRLALWTLADPPGSVDAGRIFILGIGGTLAPGQRDLAQGCHVLS